MKQCIKIKIWTGGDSSEVTGRVHPAQPLFARRFLYGSGQYRVFKTVGKFMDVANFSQ